MPLNIPALQMNGSIRPVFGTILESLVTDINQRIRDITDNGEINSANLARHVRLESLLKFVQNIDPITLNINDLHQSLLQSEALDSEEIEPYINGIRDELGRCLKQTNNNGSNALMFTSQRYPAEVTSILRAMSNLNKDQQFEILMQVTSRGFNALMIASRSHPKAVVPILEAMSSLSQDQQVKILSQVSTPDGFNALVLAAQKHPEAVTSILDAMKDLIPKQQFDILKQVASQGFNALMFASLNHPKAVDPILRAMNHLSQDDQFAILRQTSTSYGDNALMIAAQFHPEAAASILQIINNLRPREKVQILLQSDDKGNSALEFLARHGTSGANTSLSLARRAIDTIYNQDKTNHSSSAASSSSDVTPVTSGHSFFSNSTTTNPPERIEQLLIDKLILAVEVAQKKYSNYVNSGTKRSSEFNRDLAPSPISSLLHNDTGSEKSLAFSAIISKSPDVISIKKELFDFFNAKDTTYHAHSFVSYLIDELIRITPEAKIKPSTRYNKAMLTPLLDAIGNNPSKGASGALDRDELELGHNTPL